MKYSHNKARTLDWLSNRLERFQVPKFTYFSAEHWQQNSDIVIQQTMEQFSGSTIVVRSSASDEDDANFSRAGEYDSVLNVSSADPVAIRAAIDVVVASYNRNGIRACEDEIIVQVMMDDTIMSGVVFTHDLNSGAPYYVINYDDISGLTNTVTSGDGEHANRTLYIHRGATQSVRSERFQRLMFAIQELEEVTVSQFLDIEFVLDSNSTPFLLQVRNITTRPNWNRAISKRIDSTLQGIQSFVRTRFQPIDGVFGKTTVLGQMPDWNPAEMIGRAPRALAYSLYRTLITDHAWRIAREQMGYAIPTGQPLMLSLAGQPFIDTRLSFHSFLPRELSPEISEKLIDSWVSRLREKPELHDKIEFDIAITTYSFDFDSKIESLIPGVLSEAEKSEFKRVSKKHLSALLQNTNEGSVTQALAQLEILSSKRMIEKTGLGQACLNKLMAMTNECIYYGTIPFSILARHGFIARTLLFSLHNIGIITINDIEQIQSGIRTVASDLVDDMRLLQLGELEKEEFMARYGHLRPGTYDILSLRYDQSQDVFLSDVSFREKNDAPEFILAKQKNKAINELIHTEGLPWKDADQLLSYVQKSIASREYGKFIFTRNVSNILELIADYGEQHGLSRDEMSHVPVERLLEIATSSAEGSVEDRIRIVAQQEIEQHALSSAIRLPQVLFDEAGIHVIPFQVSHPNFISHKSVSAPCVQLHAHGTPPELAGKIILIENADPGYDWIFSQSIAGLITKYGGANSHMAIRCAEFGIPAAIGCGEQQFEMLTKIDHILLDCSASVIQTL